MILLLFIALHQYFMNKKTVSLLIFFFFITDGFQLIPYEWFSLGILNKPIDYALIYIILIFGYETFSNKTLYTKYAYVKSIYILLGSILFLILFNHFFYGVSWSEIFRTSRQYFLLLSFVLFRNCRLKELNALLLRLFYVTLFCSVLFIIQVVSNHQILTGYLGGGTVSLLGFTFERHYNTPYLLLFFLFYASFQNPFSGSAKYISLFILILTVILPMHRSLLGVVGFTLILGFILKYRLSGKTVVYLILCGLASFPVSGAFADRFSSGTKGDLQAIIDGDYKNQRTNMEDQTMLFRLAHFYERYDYISQDPSMYLFGIGLMTEDSDITQKRLNFETGLENEKTGKISQLDTGDISWSVLICRLGMLGTAIYLFMFYSLARYAFRDTRKRPSAFLMLVSLLLLSFSSTAFVTTIYFILPILMMSFYEKKEALHSLLKLLTAPTNA